MAEKNVLGIVTDFRKQVEDTPRGEMWTLSTCPNAPGWSNETHAAMQILKRDLERDYGENVLATYGVNWEVYDWSITLLGGPTCEVK